MKGIESDQGTSTDILAIYFALDLFTFDKMVLYECECVKIIVLCIMGSYGTISFEHLHKAIVAQCGLFGLLFISMLDLKLGFLHNLKHKQKLRLLENLYLAYNRTNDT